MSSLDIEVFGAYGQHWHVHGHLAGLEGVHLEAEHVEGLFEAPVRTAWDAAARQIGGSMKGMWRDVKDVALGFIAKPTDTDTVEEVEDAFRQSFVFRLDEWDWNAKLPRIQVTSPRGTVRSLDVQLYQEADFNPGIDFLVTEVATPTLPLRAGQPNWYEADVVTSWQTSAASGSGQIEVSNPTPLPMYPKWVLTRGTWSIPDRSWAGPPGARVVGVDKRSGRDDSSRALSTPAITAAHGGATIDLEALVGDAFMIRSASNQNLLGQMPVPGQYWSHEFPSHLQKVMLPVSLSGAPSGGGRVELIQPRRYDRPIGGVMLT